MPLRRLQAA